MASATRPTRRTSECAILICPLPRRASLRPWPLVAVLVVLGCGDSIYSSGPDDDDEPPPRGAELTNAFLNLEFTEPIALSGGPAGLPRLYVAERFGYIHQFDNDLQVEGTFAFLDIQDRVLDDGEDGGLRGFAFHPDWGVNGEVYVHYVAANPRRSVISRFLNAAGTQDHLDPTSEAVLLEIEQPEGLHPGGALRFGPDGYLYIALGDGGAEEEAQELSSLRGSILRIDVGGGAQGLPYGIPADNPLVGNADGLREEIYAWGFRDPAGLAFDPLTGRLWVPDRGERLFDELNAVTASGNYGWNVMEARACHTPPTGCVSDRLTGPIFEYGGTLLPRGVAGGFVYEGSRNPELRGRYLMADRRTGQVWAIDYDGTTALGERLVLGAPGFIAIGLDDGREPLFANIEDGLIYRFVWTSP